MFKKILKYMMKIFSSGIIVDEKKDLEQRLFKLEIERGLREGKLKK